MRSFAGWGILILGFLLGCQEAKPARADHLRDLQTAAAKAGKADWGHWGVDLTKYVSWSSHSNRLVPIYTFGIGLDEFRGQNSPYRDAKRIGQLYGYEPQGTLNEKADYFDQTDVARLQQLAAKEGKNRIILMIFDGMDWHITRNAAIYKTGQIPYAEGRGTGLHFQDYRGASTDFGSFVTSPHNQGTQVDVDAQTLINPGGTQRGGFDWRIGGTTAWSLAIDPLYCIGKCEKSSQAYTDSAASATSLCSGVKTYNDSINIDPLGRRIQSVARKLQSAGFAIGVVTSVPISHATPACAYANNVHRDDYQDLTRDLIGLPSISHPNEPLPGVDVLIGGGWGESKPLDKAQGKNYVAGNTYLTDADLESIDARKNPRGRYLVAQRTPGVPGAKVLREAADKAAATNQRLFGYFGVKGGHFPFQTADGQFDPTLSNAAPAEVYSEADVSENPTLADCAIAALDVLSKTSKRFWLMVEAGDVDWANHANNIDNSIGAVLSGDEAFKAMCDWIESHGGWKETAMIVTADHGHYFFLDKPESLLSNDSKTVAK